MKLQSRLTEILFSLPKSMLVQKLRYENEIVKHCYFAGYKQKGLNNFTNFKGGKSHKIISSLTV